MAKFHFEWDPSKAASNLRKHGVRFEDAALVFKDPMAVTVFDAGHSKQDERWYTIGAGPGSLLVVHHNYRALDALNAAVRIISSRKATSKESAQYRRRKP